MTAPSEAENTSALPTDENATEAARLVSFYTCVYCGGVAEEDDHVIPTSLDPRSKRTVRACRPCNSSKAGHWLPPQWRTLVPRAIEAGTSLSALRALSEEEAKTLLSVAVRALVQMERGRRAASYGDVGIGDLPLPNTRHGGK